MSSIYLLAQVAIVLLSASSEAKFYPACPKTQYVDLFQEKNVYKLPYQERSNCPYSGSHFWDSRSLENIEPSFFRGSSFSSDSHLYKELKLFRNIENLENITLYLYRGDETSTKEIAIRRLGNGGSKQAVELKDRAEALIIPNLDEDSPREVSSHWERTVCSEVSMSNFLKSIGIMSPVKEPVLVSKSPEKQNAIPAYLSDNFDYLAEKGITVIDIKNECLTRLRLPFKKTVFFTEKERSNEENWIAIFTPFLNDLATLYAHGVIIGLDSSNAAIIDSGCGDCPGSMRYKVRYFGFDFSGKYGGYNDLPKRNSDFSHLEKTVKRVIDRYVEVFLALEFDDSCYSFSMLPKELYSNLLEKFTSIVLKKIEQMHLDRSNSLEKV